MNRAPLSLHKSKLIILLLIVMMYSLYQRAIDQLNEQSEGLEAQEEQDAREAEEIFFNHVRELQAELNQASVHCKEILSDLKPFQQIRSRMIRCLSAATEGPLLIQLEADLRGPRWIIRSIKGADPLISVETRTRCVDELIKSTPLSTELKSALKGEAQREKPMWPSLRLEISRTHDGGLQHQEVGLCMFTDDEIKTKVEGMLEIRDQPHIVGQPAHQDRVYQDLKRCDQHLAPALQSSVTLFRYALTGRSNELPKEHSCVPSLGEARATLDETSACLCRVIQSHLRQEAMIPLKITSTTPDGREVTSEGAVQSVPVRSEHWVARVPGADRPRFYQLSALD